MVYVILADLTVIAHALFVLFVACGGVAVLRWRRLAWLHVPAVLWGIAVELAGWVCPLTYLENHFRLLGGGGGYGGTFIEHYLVPVVYPEGLTRQMQSVAGLAVLLVNGFVYRAFWRGRRR